MVAPKYERVLLGDVFNLQMGKTPAREKNEYWNNGDNPWVSIADLSSYDKYVAETKETISDLGVSKSGIKLVPANTVLMSFKLSLGKTAITRHEIYTNEAIMAFIPNGTKDVDVDYLYHLFSNMDWMKGTNRAVMGSTLNKATLTNIEIPLPPLDEQKRIADVLDKASELIKKRKEQIRLMDELAKSLFIEMFGDPVENPMGWEIKLLGELGEFKNGINFGQKDTGYVVKFLGVGDFKSQNVFDNIDSLSSVKLTEKPNPEYFLNDGDIIFVRSNGSKELVGRNIIIYPRGKLVTFSGFCIRFRVFSKQILPSYLQNLLLIPSQKSRLLENGRGCNIQNLNQQMLSSINIPLPPLPLQQEFADRIEAIEKQKALLQDGLAKMETAYKALMQEYFG